MYIVCAQDKEGRVRTDMEELFNVLERWTHERCVAEPLPEYTRTDPHYDPEIYRYLHSHNVKSDFIVGMYWHDLYSLGYSTMNTLGHWHGDNTLFMWAPNARPENLNPYKESEIGETVTFWGKRCGAEGCDVMKAERTFFAECDRCGAKKESCKLRGNRKV